MPRLADILGQDKAVEALRRAIRGRRTASGYLFSGPEGVGKRTLAVAFAAALNCQREPGEGCDGCASCAKIMSANHPDLLLLERDGKFIKVEQVRGLQQLTAYPPNEGGTRVVVIDGAEHLHPSAGNALLKSVEEPRADTIFVLVSSAAHRVLPTLRSRCQHIRSCPLPRPLVSRVVAAHSERDAEDQAAAVAVAEGSPGRALRLLESEQLQQAQQIASGILAAAERGDGVTMFALSEQVGREREAVLEALELLRIWFRDLLLVQADQPEERLINREAIDRLRTEAARLDRRAILSDLRAVQEAHQALLGNVNPRLTVEALVLRTTAAAGAGAGAAAPR